MQILIAPSPLPVHPTKGGVGNPKEWGDKALVSLTYQLPESPTPITTFAKSNGDFERTPGGFQTAIDLAQARAAKNSRWSGVGAAHAVLQAADGAYYITALEDGLGLGQTVIDNGVRKGVKFLDATASHLALKAIVGAKTWVDFSTPPA